MCKYILGWIAACEIVRKIQFAQSLLTLSLPNVEPTHSFDFEVRHPRFVSNKSNCKVYAYIVKHNYVLGGMLFTVRKAQLHVSATNFGHHQVLQ